MQTQAMQVLPGAYLSTSYAELNLALVDFQSLLLLVEYLQVKHAIFAKATVFDEARPPCCS